MSGLTFTARCPRCGREVDWLAVRFGDYGTKSASEPAAHDCEPA